MREESGVNLGQFCVLVRRGPNRIVLLHVALGEGIVRGVEIPPLDVGLRAWAGGVQCDKRAATSHRDCD